MNNNDKKNETKETVKVKYKDPKGGEAKTYELEIKDEEQEKDNKKFNDDDSQGRARVYAEKGISAGSGSAESNQHRRNDCQSYRKNKKRRELCSEALGRGNGIFFACEGEQCGVGIASEWCIGNIADRERL